MITPTCFADVGRWINDPDNHPKPGDEVLIRSAAGRLYYAAYHAALSQADREGYELKSSAKGVHDELIKRYFDNGKMLVGRKLRSMKEIRCHADYDLNKPFERQQLAEMTLRLNDVLNLTQ